jgi:L-lactate dehydrogenase complex protein LldG
MNTRVSAREEILGRIRIALADRPVPSPVQRDYRPAGSSTLDPAELLERFVDRLVDYKASVHRCTSAAAAATIGSVLADRGIERLLVATGFPGELLTEVTAEQVGDEPPLSTAELDRVDGVLTTCAVAVAETGTIVLDAGAGQGRRALTLVPDYHLIVVRAEQLVAGVPDAVAVLPPSSPLTWISGPSATSDIELSRVEGVHGPRTLDVVLIGRP